MTAELANGKHFLPFEVPLGVEPGLAEYLRDSFEGVKQAHDVMHYNAYDPHFEEPERVFDGMVTLADGTNWDPGNGAGLYLYYGGEWIFLCTAVPRDIAPTGSSVSPGTIITGDHTTVAALDGTYFQVQESSSGFAVTLTFSGVARLDGFVTYGRYTGNSAHTCYKQAWDYVRSVWVTLEQMASGSQDFMYSRSVPQANFLSSGGAAQLRYFHSTPATAGHNLYLDAVFARGV